MKLKIINKYADDRGGFTFYSLQVAFSETEIYNKIVDSLEKRGADPTKIEKTIRVGEFNGSPSYTFYLGCSAFTSGKVDRFGIIDALVNFELNGEYINPRIAIVDRKEQVLGYEPPEEEVTGWAGGNEPTAEFVKPSEQANPHLPSAEPTDDLPF